MPTMKLGRIVAIKRYATESKLRLTAEGRSGVAISLHPSFTGEVLPILCFCLDPAVKPTSIGTTLIPSSLNTNLWTSLEWFMPRDFTM